MEDTQKAMTLRLSGDQAADLETVARVDGISVAEAVRRAVAAHIEARRKDVEFKERLQRLVNENREILDRLA